MNRHRMIVLAPPRPASAYAGETVARLLAKADVHNWSAHDDASLFGDLFVMVPGTVWPAAAMTRALDAGDADDIAWVRADPAHFRVELANVRMLACGDIGQSASETTELVAALAPIFGDEGFELSAPHPRRWYLRAFAGNTASDLPQLPPPEVALGGDLFELWPEDTTHRRWRRLFNEAQIVLAHHAVNRHRAEHGKPAINGLWFWGAGRLPASISTPVATAVTDDVLLSSLAKVAGIHSIALAEATDSDARLEGDLLLDLRNASSIDDHLLMLADRWKGNSIGEIEWRTADGRWTLKRWHRWRLWR